jgi:hypothetical protein
MHIPAGAKVWIAALLLILAGCNVYNPDGEGDATADPLTNGEELYRKGRFAQAMASFSAAIAADSNNSLAYYGYAKATARFYRLDNLGILNDLEATQVGASFAFTEGHSDSLLTLRLQAASRIRRVLYLLTDRDTLSRWYAYIRDSTSKAARSDTARDARIAFMRDYLEKADADEPGYRARNKFPLTDFRMPYDKVIVDFAAFEMMYVFTRFRDLNRNGIIDSADNLIHELSFTKGEGGFAIDSLSKIADDLEGDPQATEDLNGLIQGMQSGLGDIAQLAQLIGLGGSGDTAGGAGGEASTNIDSVITSMGEAILFYQFADQLDNDGDGCVDEEVLDDKDNDGDGYVDEDARITLNPLFERTDNDHNGRMNDSGWVNDSTAFVLLEDPIGPRITPGQPNRHLLAFVHRFYTLHPDSAGRFVKIPKGDARHDLRVKIQRDSLALPSRWSLPNYAAKLDSAKTLVGGCWRNYAAPGLGKRARR